MDYILDLCDDHFFDPYIYPASFPRNHFMRQLLSLTVIVNVSGFFLYTLTAAADFYFAFDKRLMQHPQFLPNQIRREITYSLRSLPIMSALTIVMFMLEVRGYSRLFDSFEESMFGRWSAPLYTVTFIMFTDCLIYWIHRALHSKFLYKRLHKAHHTWKIPTPFASHAFHPLDGFLQSSPYHIYVFLFPMHKLTYLVLFFFVNIWTVSIHDGNYKVPDIFKPIVNGSAHHQDHHLFFNFNYGQFFTLWDRIGKSYRYPSSFEGVGPLEDIYKLHLGGATDSTVTGANGKSAVAKKGKSSEDRAVHQRNAKGSKAA